MVKLNKNPFLSQNKIAKFPYTYVELLPYFNKQLLYVIF